VVMVASSEVMEVASPAVASIVARRGESLIFSSLPLESDCFLHFIKNGL
jgi:hypothetical protein